MVSDDYWVLDVLYDIAKYAEAKGHHRLKASLEHASDEYLTELRDRHLARLLRQGSDAQETEKGGTILEFRSKRVH